MTAGIVDFDATFFVARYPELAYIGPTLLPLYFSEACMYCDNTPQSPIRDANVGKQRYIVLHMATAHIAALNAPKADGSEASPLVGRIQSATQGSVSVSTQNDYPPGSAQWWQQTKYGAAFFAATTQFRLFRYRANVGRNQDVYSPLMNDSQ
jgi:hypothetical protein